VFLYAFDLIGLDGDDLRRDSLVVRKATRVVTLEIFGSVIVTVGRAVLGQKRNMFRF